MKSNNSEDKDARLEFIEPGQKRSGIRVLVYAAPDLEMQAFNLRDVVTECQNVVVELLASMIQCTDTGRVSVEDYGTRGQKLVTEIFQIKEPQLAANFATDFEVKADTEDNRFFMTMTFKCSFNAAIVSMLKGNGGAATYVQ